MIENEVLFVRHNFIDRLIYFYDVRFYFYPRVRCKRKSSLKSGYLIIIKII